MRGFPPLHLLLFSIGFALFAIPLTRLTQSRAAASAPSPAASSSPAEALVTPAILRLRCAHLPAKISLTFNGRELLPAAAPAFAVEESLQVPIPPDGIELKLEAEWPGGTPDTAISVELEPDGHETLSQTRWSTDGRLSEILVYQWNS